MLNNKGEGKKVFINNEYHWHSLMENSSTCYFKGWLRYQGNVYRDESGAKKIIEMFSNESISDPKHEINTLEGNFGFILETPGYILGSVDKIRSFPLFYSTNKKDFGISNSARYLQQQKNLSSHDDASIIEFKMSGYVTGHHTLIKGLQQLQPGEFLLWSDEKETLETSRFFKYIPENLSTDREDQLIEELNEVTTNVFKKLIERLNGRPVWVPLTAGYDSRLILCMLKKLGYDNLNAFHYGAPGNGNWERKYSLALAQKLNIPWKHVVFSRKYIHEIFNSKTRKEYGAFADHLCSLPAYTYVFYLEWIKKNKLLSDDSVMIKGHAGDFISGNHLSEMITNTPVKLSSIYNGIIDKHFSLWTDLKTGDHLKQIRDRIKEVISDIEFDGSSQSAANILDFWEWNERQCKYVINAQAAYNYWGVDWELPLWDEDYIRFWKKIPWQLKFNQKLYRNFLFEMDPLGAFKNHHPSRRLSWSKLLIVLPFFSIVKMFPKERQDKLVSKYLRYLLNPLNTHAVIPYFEHLKKSEYHRSALSFQCKSHLEETLISK